MGEKKISMCWKKKKKKITIIIIVVVKVLGEKLIQRSINRKFTPKHRSISMRTKKKKRRLCMGTDEGQLLEEKNCPFLICVFFSFLRGQFSRWFPLFYFYFFFPDIRLRPIPLPPRPIFFFFMRSNSTMTSFVLGQWRLLLQSAHVKHTHDLVARQTCQPPRTPP